MNEKRANLQGVREVRGLLRVDADAPAGFVGADWTGMCELRADDDADSWNFNGEASVVEHEYSVFDAYGEFRETIAEGAFKRTLGNDPLVSFVYMHDLSSVMAQTRSENLELKADPNLSVFARLDKSDVDVQRVAPKVRRGDANSMSFAFKVTGQEWNEDYTERRITEVNLHGGDVSIITTGHGANPAASGAMRQVSFSDVLGYVCSQTLDDEARAQVAAALGFDLPAQRSKPGDNAPAEIVLPVDDGFDLREYEEQMQRDALRLLSAL